MLAKERDRGDAAARSLALSHARALVTHLCSVSPDAVFFSEVHLRGRAQRQGELEQFGTGSKTDQAQAQSAHDAWSNLTSCPELAGYTWHRSLHATLRGKAGVAVCLRPGLMPLSVRFSMDAGAPPGAHHPEGRVILLEFATLRLLLTYSPNLGSTPESHQRRAAFDAQLLTLVSQKHGKPLIWAGDLNVAPTVLDYTGAAIPRDLPGTTAEKQARFAGILAAGSMRDAWRSLNSGVSGGWTWRGGPMQVCGCASPAPVPLPAGVARSLPLRPPPCRASTLSSASSAPPSTTRATPAPSTSSARPGGSTTAPPVRSAARTPPAASSPRPSTGTRPASTCTVPACAAPCAGRGGRARSGTPSAW